jgi:uncharacterized membrane protein
MMELVMGTIMMLIVAVVAIFVLLIAINFVLVLKLRSSIPQRSLSNPSAEQGMREADGE